MVYKKDGMIVYNCSYGKDNFSQRNNEFKWGEKNSYAKVNASTMCNFTSMVMALSYAGFIFPTGDYNQPEDNLAEFFMNSDKVDAYYKEKFPAMYNSYKKDVKGCYTPNEVHSVLSFGVNEWFGTKVTEFISECHIAYIIEEIKNERPVVISGAFPTQTGILNHIVCLVGAAWPDDYANSNYQKNRLPTYWIVDDPWGYTKDYRAGKSGNDVLLENDFFIQNIKPVNSMVKYAHIFKKPAALI